MTDSEKDKQAAALKRIKELATQRSTSNRPGGEPSAPTGSGGSRRPPKKSGPAHRPQGG